MSNLDILVLVGSMRAASINRQFAETAVERAPEGVVLRIEDVIRDLPFYNEDLDVEGSVPAAAAALRADIAEADALLIFTPEHNGTVPAVLKNAIDWASRPFGTSTITGKPVAVFGTAFGQYGGVWAQDETRKALGIAGAAVIDDVRLAVPSSVVRFAETHPRDDAEAVAELDAALAALVGRLRQPVAA